MLSSINLNDKTYDDVLREAITKVTVLTDEWTDFNDSDPGVTILQNLSAFSILLQSKINIVTEKTRQQLLKLVGIVPQGSMPATVLVSCKSKEQLRIAPMQRFMLDNRCYQNEETVEVSSCWLQAVHMEENGIKTDITHLVMGGNQRSASIFTDNPKNGNSFLLVLGAPPAPNETFIVHFAIAESFKRNSFKEGSATAFATLSFELLTENGYKSVPFIDSTHALLNSGAVTLTMPAEPLKFYDELDGYIIKCTLKQCEYDIAPQVANIDVGLFPVVQKETKAACFTYPGGPCVVINSAMVRFDNIIVFVSEEGGGEYLMYSMLNEADVQNGRYCIKTVLEDGSVQLIFDKEIFGYEPAAGADTIKVVCYDDVAVIHRQLGVMFGYEDQIMDIDIEGDLLEQELTLLAETTGDDGILRYRFITPSSDSVYGTNMEIQSENGNKLCIHSPGELDVSTLYLANLAVTSGSSGNVRANNTLKATLFDLDEVLFVNPSVGTGGKSRDTIQDMISTFAEEIRHPVCTVLESDFEALVMQTPALCIKKVCAIADSTKNVVTIAVEPQSSTEQLPMLTSLYQKEILHHLEPHRMLTTRIAIISPIYVPLTVIASVRVNSYFTNPKENIREAIINILDYVNSDKPFTDIIYSSTVVKEILELPCVSTVEKLTIIPESHGRMLNGNVHLDDFVLGYVKSCVVETSTS